MKKLSGVFICLLLFTFISSARIIEVADAGITDKLKAVIAAKNVAAPGGPSADFSDDFNRTNAAALGANWDEDPDLLEITSNQVAHEGGAGDAIAKYNATATSSSTQYVKAKIVSLSDDAQTAVGVMLRSEASANCRYFVGVQQDTGGIDVHWYSWNTWGGLIDADSATTWSAGDTLAVIVEGTGTSTRFYCWKNPTNEEPLDEGSACTDTGQPCWDSAGDAADMILNNEAENHNCNGGTYVGVQMYSDGGQLTQGAVDDFMGGTVPSSD